MALPNLTWPVPIPDLTIPAGSAQVTVQHIGSGAPPLEEQGTLTWKLEAEETNQPGGIAFRMDPTSVTTSLLGTVALTDPKIIWVVRSAAGNRAVSVGGSTIYPTVVQIVTEPSAGLPVGRTTVYFEIRVNGTVVGVRE